MLYADEKKHWQRKAQSYSKELVRHNTKGEDITQLREHNLSLKTRVEVSKGINCNDVTPWIDMQAGIDGGEGCFQGGYDEYCRRGKSREATPKEGIPKEDACKIIHI